MNRQQLHTFIEAHPEGWNHEDWLGLLAELQGQGIDDDPEVIGSALETERLAWELRRRGVPGLGPKRIDAIVDRFGSLWELQQAGADQVAELKAIPGRLAEQIVKAVS